MNIFFIFSASRWLYKNQLLKIFLKTIILIHSNMKNISNYPKSCVVTNVNVILHVTLYKPIRFMKC